MNKRSFWFSLAALALAVGWSAHLQAQVANAALVVGLSGPSTFRTEAAGATQAQPVQNFWRLHRGDTVGLPAASRITIAYTGSGMVESWLGPAQFRVGDLRSNGIKGGPDQLQQLPRSMLQRLARAPELLADLKNRQGLVPTRDSSPPEPTAVQQARADQQAAKEQAGAADAPAPELPELNLFLALYESGRYREADTVIQALQRQQPGNAMVAALAQEFQRVYRKPIP